MRLKSLSLSFGTQVFKAFGDDSRLRILYLLYHKKELTISDLEHILDFTQTKTSRHMQYLKHASIVASRKEDQYVFYFVKDEVYDLVNHIMGYLQKDPSLLKDLETYDTLYSNRELSVNRLQSKRYQA